MIRLSNPAYPIAEKAAEHEAAVLATIEASGQPCVSGDDIRAALPDIADDLADPVLVAIAVRIGVSIR